MAGSTRREAELTSSQTADEQPSEVANPPAAHPARVAQARYAEGEGWELGQAAPADRFREVDAQGNLTGKATAKAPAGKYARQVAVKGQPVTNSVRAELELD